MKKLNQYQGAGILFWTCDEQGQLYVLLGKRTCSPGKGKWSIPGGTWDQDLDRFTPENIVNYKQTAIRESWEEVGFSVDDENQLLLLWQIHLIIFHFKVFSYKLPSKIESVRYQEFSEVQWFPADSIPKPHVPFLKRQISLLRKNTFVKKCNK